MNRPLTALALALVATAASAQVSVSGSVSIIQPGVYGRIDFGQAPPPPVVYAQPVLIAPPVVAVPAQPVYLYVPPAHQRNWRHWCGYYHACGVPVYFVQERWVRDRYDHDRGHDRDEDRHYDRGDDHGRGGWHGRGEGHDRGRGHGEGRDD